MARFLSFLVLLAMLLGSSARAEEEPSYSDVFKGVSRDALITRYGAPSHTIKMDDGSKVLEYKTHQRIINVGKQPREDSYCALRFWLVDSRVFKVDALGNADSCVYFLKTGERERYIDYNKLTP